jgi:DNA-binding NarL/FixJ family response regulator
MRVATGDVRGGVQAAPSAAPADRVSVVIQQPLRLIRQGLLQLLSAYPRLNVRGAAVQVDGLMPLCAQQAPDVVVISGDAVWWQTVQVAVSVRRALPNARFVVTVASPAGVDTDLLESHGLRRWVSHRDGIEQIVSAILAESVAPIAILKTPRAQVSTPAVLLTVRERGILELIGRGFTTREISDELDIATRGVENSKRRVFAKLGVCTQAEAVAVALQLGLIGG